ncbi:MAG: DUF2934 domain-containing protein [Candidatus Zixiibacteriota bacterium]
MAAEVNKNTWSRFFKKFNQTNQYRPAKVVVKQLGQTETNIDLNLLFMGLTIGKKGKRIDNVEIFTAQYDPERLAEPITSIKQPVRVVIEKDADKRDSSLWIEGMDGSVVKVDLSGEKTPQQQQMFVEKVAYALSERRGFAPGGEIDDWLEAEKRVKETELQFVK